MSSPFRYLDIKRYGMLFYLKGTYWGWVSKQIRRYKSSRYDYYVTYKHPYNFNLKRKV